MASLSPLKTGILSVGDMGVGIAKLLIAHGFPVATNCQGRSEDTVERARNANVELLSSDLELVQQCSVILSVVPPRDAEATAQRIIDALAGGSRKDDLYFADLNAVSPTSAKAIAHLFEKSRAPVRFIDGCILGAPPRSKDTPDAGTNVSKSLPDPSSDWIRPRLPISGPHTLSTLSPDGKRLSSVLGFRSISPEIGAASGLKMCFAALTKGYTAIATQSLTTAHRLGVADALREEMGSVIPSHLAATDSSVPVMVPKAYRWVKEMEEIAATFREEGGWGGDADIFGGVAGVYREVAANETLGKEKTGKRQRGTDAKDVAALMAEGLEKKRKKME